jgi:hypothetical protein
MEEEKIINKAQAHAKSTCHIPTEITFLPISFLRPCIALSVFAVYSLEFARVTGLPRFFRNIEHSYGQRKGIKKYTSKMRNFNDSHRSELN